MNIELKNTIRDKLVDCDTQLDTFVSYFENNKLEFCEIVINLVESNTILHSSILARILACMLGKNCKPMAVLLLNSPLYKLPEILKTCEILDSRRFLAQLNKKMHSLSEKNTKKRGKIQSQINNLMQLNSKYFDFSLTSSKIKVIVDNWIKKIPADKLEFYAMTYELDTWKNLANLLHLKASDFQLDWFLGYAYGGSIPESSVVYACKNITSVNSFEIITKYKPDYNFIRGTKVILSSSSKAVIATYTDLNILLWWLHEFIDSIDALNVIVNRMKSSEYDLPYGVLIDKLFVSKNGCTIKYQPYSTSNNFNLGWQTTKNTNAYDTNKLDTQNPLYKIYENFLTKSEEQLKKYMLNFENNKIAIFGDASGSMEIAIKTSSIIMSILCAISNAEMSLFRNANEKITNPPKDVKDVVKFNETCKAGGGTAPATCLEPYYNSGKKLDTIIIVTDEEENGYCQGMYFSQMFDLYCKKIKHVPKLVFISFLEINRGNKGQMVTEINTKYPQYSETTYQYIFDKHKPDLTKLDSVLTKLAVL